MNLHRVTIAVALVICSMAPPLISCATVLPAELTTEQLADRTTLEGLVGRPVVLTQYVVVRGDSQVIIDFRPPSLRQQQIAHFGSTGRELGRFNDSGGGYLFTDQVNCFQIMQRSRGQITTNGVYRLSGRIVRKSDRGMVETGTRPGVVDGCATNGSFYLKLDSAVAAAPPAQITDGSHRLGNWINVGLFVVGDNPYASHWLTDETVDDAYGQRYRSVQLSANAVSAIASELTLIDGLKDEPDRIKSWFTSSHPYGEGFFVMTVFADGETTYYSGPIAQRCRFIGLLSSYSIDAKDMTSLNGIRWHGKTCE